jgi:hypothetical protein
MPVAGLAPADYRPLARFAGGSAGIAAKAA